MIKSELVNKISEHLTHIPIHKIKTGIDELLNHFTLTLSQHKRIEIRDFGSFSVHHRAPRVALNPKTQEKITTNINNIPHFKAGKALKEKIQEAKDKCDIKED